MRLPRVIVCVMIYAASTPAYAATTTLEDRLQALVDEARYRPAQAQVRLSALEAELPGATPKQQAQYLQLMARSQTPDPGAGPDGSG